MITVYIKKIKDIPQSEQEIIKNTLSAEALERINKKRSNDLHLASLCALSLLTDDERADLSYTESGRPHFKALNKDISISHSKNYVAVSISNSKATHVGIDIEDVEQNTLSNTAKTRFLTENEQLSLQNYSMCNFF